MHYCKINYEEFELNGLVINENHSQVGFVFGIIAIKGGNGVLRAIFSNMELICPFLKSILPFPVFYL